MLSLYPMYPIGPDPPAAACVVCRGPAGSGYARCYQCEAHEALGHGLLADAVVPISYAVKGTRFAEDLWRYKSPRGLGTSARGTLQALLLAFLGDHTDCVWRRAAMPGPTHPAAIPGPERPAAIPGPERPAAMPGPDRLAVVPSGVGRPGSHPLLALTLPHVSLPLWPLAIRPGRQGRDLDLHRFQAGPGPRGCAVLLLDDTWVSGASAQSAAAALKLAGAGRVALVVLGRHVNPADPRAARFAAGLAPGPYDPAACAVHS